ncbi:MAG: hypothetical protein EXR86_11940 [Gammaproteobacteria bacterium]|nr:hypothetical protein [Gammaproteobacteria bacterium]
MNEISVARDLEDEVAEVLSYRYGDGTLYFPRSGRRHHLDAAIAGGFVSEEGFVTRKRRNWIARRVAQ